MSATISLGNSVDKKAACNALDIPRATFYRHLSSKEVVKECRRPGPPLALSADERQAVLDVAHEKRFWDATPYQMYATLLDQGRYLSMPTVGAA